MVFELGFLQPNNMLLAGRLVGWSAGRLVCLCATQYIYPSHSQKTTKKYIEQKQLKTKTTECLEMTFCFEIKI